MFEDPDGRARETRAQHQGGVIQLITQNETTLRELKNKKKKTTRFHIFLGFISH